MIQQMKVNLSLSLGCSNCSAVPELLLSSHVSSSVYSSCIKIRTANVYCSLPVGLFLEFLFQEFLNIRSFQPHGNPQRQTLLSSPFDRWENRGTAVLLDELFWGLAAAGGVSPEPTPFAMHVVGTLGHGTGTWPWQLKKWDLVPVSALRQPTVDLQCRLSPFSASLCILEVGGGTDILLSYGGEKKLTKGGTVVKSLPASAGDPRDVGSILGWGRSPGEGNSNPLQYSCLENSMDRGAWWATVHRVSGSRTWLSNWAHSIWAKSNS